MIRANDSKYKEIYPLFETEWLSRHLNDNNIRIVDVRSQGEYDKSHIKNAVHLNFKEITGDETMKRSLPPENTPDILGNLGIDESTCIIAYDEDSSHNASRLFWILKFFGHKKAGILNGGWKKWLMENRELSGSKPIIERKSFTPQQDPDQIASADYILKNISNPGVIMLEVRSK